MRGSGETTWWRRLFAGGRVERPPFVHQHYQSLWLYRGRAFAPAIVRTLEGDFVEQLPVVDFAPSVDEILGVVSRALASPPVAPRPMGWKSPMVDAVGAATLTDFHRHALGLAVYDMPGGRWEVGGSVWPAGARRVRVLEAVQIDPEAFPAAAVRELLKFADSWPGWRETGQHT